MRRRPLLISIALSAAACGPNPGEDVDGRPGDLDAAPSDAPVADAAPPDGPVDDTCVFVPAGEFNPGVECVWSTPAVGGAYAELDDVVSTPVVINLTDDDGDLDVDLDDVPDIAFIAYQLQGGGACPAGVTCGCCNSSGVLRVVSGGCDGSGVLAEHYTIGATEIEADTGVAGVWLDNSGGLATGDIDADGSPDLVASVNNGGTIAFERDGTVKWYQPLYPTGDDRLAASQPAIADLDGDGDPEVIQGRVVLNGADGTLKWEGVFGVGTNGFLGPVSVVGDLDLDGTNNVLAGATMYAEDGSEVWTHAYTIPITATNCQSTGFPCDGFTATGNFDADDEGEVVIARAGVVYVLNHDGTPMEIGAVPVEIPLPIDDCTKNEGGPPTVADFDGDGQPEIGVAGADFYVVVDLECFGVDPLPAQCSDPGIRWRVANFDCSSRVTGSSVFDFEGDGRAEVIYNDEQNFRIFDGVDGTVRVDIDNFSHTRLEMPIVADVDNDGNAEIVFVENNNGTGGTQGIRVWGDLTDSWVPTRRVWNQHGYHVTNVSELGAIPMIEPVNWLYPTINTVAGVMNNFRQNLPDFDAFVAPDLTVELEIDADACRLFATVCNEGALVVGAGVPVRYFDNTTMTEIPCNGGPPTTTNPLSPGACVELACEWLGAPEGPVDVRACVDNDGYACTSGTTGGNNECREANNFDDATASTACDGIK